MSRTRELAKNDTLVRAYLELCEKNIIGKAGFNLQCQLKNDDGKLNEPANSAIEWAFWDFGKLSNGYLTMDHGMGHHEFDKLILRTLIIDGEVFIRVRHPKNKYGLSFELVDSMSIDFAKIREAGYGSNAIVLGIEIDQYGAPMKYYLKQGNSVCYQAGKEEYVPADEIIHIYRKEFPLQVRGFSILNAALDPLKQIADYNLAEILAAKTGAVLALAYERNGQAQAGQFMSDSDAGIDDDPGTFAQTLEPRNEYNRPGWLFIEERQLCSSTF